MRKGSGRFMIHLKKVRNNFERRSKAWLDSVDGVRYATDHKARDILVAHIAIELQTSLGYVARSCYLAGMLGGRSAAGTTIRALSKHTQLSALQLAAAVIKRSPKQVPGRDEPSWHSGDHLTRVIGAVNPANSSDILTALGIYPDARKAVLAVRNFYAHRGRHTLEEIRHVLLTEYAVALASHPTAYLLNPPSGRPHTFLEQWIWNYRDIVEAMCGS